MNDLNGLLLVCYVIAAMIEMAAPVVLAVVLARRLPARWRFFGIGVLVFLLSQGLTRIPAMMALQMLPAFQEAMAEPVYFWSFLLFAAFTAGLFEEGGRWLAYRYLFTLQDRQWRNALMMGAGHGGLESFGIGVLVLLAMVNYLVLTLAPRAIMPLTNEQLELALSQFTQLQGWEPLLGAWERLCTLAVHCALSIMVLLAFTRGARWWWIAVLTHTTVNFIAVGVLQLAAKAWGRTAGMLVSEAAIALMAVAAIGFILPCIRHAERDAPYDA